MVLITVAPFRVKTERVGNVPNMTGCRLFGHRYRFWPEDHTMHWECQRGCGAGGAKRYGTAAEASRYARAFDREDSDTIGRRAPLVGLLPLRLARAAVDRRDRRGHGA